MENVKKALVIMPFVLSIEIVAFFYLVFRGLRGEPMPTFGLVIMAQLLTVRYLSALYDKYKESITRQKNHNKAPQYICRWSFNPLDQNGSTDGYIDKLIDFLEAKEGEVFIPSKSQEFIIWWEDEHAERCFLTDKVTKMIHQKDGQILIETISGDYIGQTSFNIDFIVNEDMRSGGE